LKKFLKNEDKEARFVYKNETGDVLLLIDLTRLASKYPGTKIITTEFYVPNISETIMVSSIDSDNESKIFEFINEKISGILMSKRYTKFLESKPQSPSTIKEKQGEQEAGKLKRYSRKSKSKPKRRRRYSQRKNKSKKSKKSKKYNRHY
jgi:hypothetical protein